MRRILADDRVHRPAVVVQFLLCEIVQTDCERAFGPIQSTVSRRKRAVRSCRVPTVWPFYGSMRASLSASTFPQIRSTRPRPSESPRYVRRLSNRDLLVRQFCSLPTSFPTSSVLSLFPFRRNFSLRIFGTDASSNSTCDTSSSVFSTTGDCLATCPAGYVPFPLFSIFRSAR